MPEVIVAVDAEGNTIVQAKGVKGSGCTALTRAIEAAIGVTTADVKTPEFTQAAQQNTGAKATQ